MQYNHKEIEQKWRKHWEEHPVNVETPDKKPCKPMFNCLVNERSSVFSFFLSSIRKSQNAMINLLSKRK